MQHLLPHLAICHLPPYSTHLIIEGVHKLELDVLELVGGGKELPQGVSVHMGSPGV